MEAGKKARYMLLPSVRKSRTATEEPNFVTWKFAAVNKNQITKKKRETLTLSRESNKEER